MTTKIDQNDYQDLDLAEKMARESILSEPDNANNYLMLSRILWDKGKTKEAIEILSRARDRFTGAQERTIRDQMESISGSEELWETLVLTITSGKEIKIPIKYCGHKDNEESLDMALWEYANGLMDEDEEERFFDAIRHCKYCLAKLISIQRTLNEIQDEPFWPYEKVSTAIEKKLRTEKAESLTHKFADMVKKAPSHLQASLESIGQKIDDLFRNTFTYPSPCFSPVFGEARITILSPFGKVHYPIVFEWNHYEEADQYEISIEDVGWSRNTTDTKIEVQQADLTLSYGKEYMWELRVLKKEEAIEEITGFITLGTEEEINEIEDMEKGLTNIAPEEDRLLLLAGVLEEKEFFIEAIEKYKRAYAIDPSDGIAYRIASCYDKLELEELRDEWNRKIVRDVND
jgi:tetratricopeptide (TPR) repeat protein